MVMLVLVGIILCEYMERGGGSEMCGARKKNRPASFSRDGFGYGVSGVRIRPFGVPQNWRDVATLQIYTFTSSSLGRRRWGRLRRPCSFHDAWLGMNASVCWRR